MHTTSDPAPEFSASRVLRLLRSGTCSTADATLLSTHLVRQCESGDAAATFAWRATQSLARVALDATALWAARAGAATALERVAKTPGVRPDAAAATFDKPQSDGCSSLRVDVAPFDLTTVLAHGERTRASGLRRRVWPV